MQAGNLPQAVSGTGAYASLDDLIGLRHTARRLALPRKWSLSGVAEVGLACGGGGAQRRREGGGVGGRGPKEKKRVALLYAGAV